MDSSSGSKISDLEMLAEMKSGAAMIVALAATTASDETSTKYRGGSKQGRAANRNFKIEEKNAQLYSDFFCKYSDGEPVFTEV